MDKKNGAKPILMTDVSNTKQSSQHLEHISDIYRAFLGSLVHTSNPRRCHRGWCQVVICASTKFMLPDALKMHSMALSVL